MSKKPICLISLVLVLGLVLTSTAKAAESDLAGYWKFDEGSGTTAHDSSGNENDGTLVGGAQWVAGNFGGAIQFNGSNAYVTASHIPLDSRSFTVTMWVNPVLYTSEQIVFSQGTSGTDAEMHFRLNGDGSVRMGFYNNDLDTPGGLIKDNNWYHITFWYDFENQNRRIYIDGELEAELAASPYLGTSGDTIIGSWHGDTQWFQGIIDDVRIYNRILSDVEILGVMAGSGAEYPFASGPDPADGALLMDTWISLGWRTGDFAVSHDVYFGENFDDVNNGTGDTFRGNQDTLFYVAGFPGFAYPDGLIPGTTYYWRIDEVNDTEPNSPWKGPVWSFWIPPCTAYDPYPSDDAEYIDLNVELSWTAGFGTKMNHVYFGDDFDDVNNAVVGISQLSTTYTPGTLELEKIYYWRVDEFDGAAMHKGDILSFKTLSQIPITNPNLIGWWKLDGAASSTAAVDWSGYDHHGTIMGDPEWVIGYQGDALELDGDGDYVDIGSVGISGMDPRTIAGCVKASTTDIPSGTTVFGFAHDGSGDGTYFDIGVDNAGNYGLYIGGWSFPLRAVDTRWHHFAATYDGSEGRWYVDGQLIDRLAGAIATTDEVRIGARLSNNNYFPGLVDDVRIYNKALTQNEIIEVMRGNPELASGPGPGNGSTVDVIGATSLSWLPGEKAAQHDVYFGADKEAVADADTSDTTDIYRGRQGVTIYTPPEGVEWGGGSYYWRIDEYNTDATISKGNVWCFTVADYLIVDDFEDYDVGNNEIWWVWLDGSGYASHPTKPPYTGNGTGSMVGDETTGSYMEETIVHSGSQSMPVFYDNNQQGKLKYSEVEMTLSWQRDWTVEGVGVLTIWFHGAASNGAEPLYIALNGNTVVTHDNPNAAQIETWTQWDIDLQVFADLGVDLTNVETIALGFGDRNNPQPDGSGKMCFDDIRLYRPSDALEE